MFDKVTGDAAAHAAAQRADAAAQRAEMQAAMEKEIERREREAADKARLQLRVEQLEKEAATARPAITQHDSVTPATTGALQSAPGDAHTLVTSADSHAPLPPPTVDSVNSSAASTLAQPTVTVPNVHSLALSAPASADNQHTTLPVPNSLMTDHPRPLLSSNVMPAFGAINYPHRQLTDSALMSAPAPSMTDYALMSDMTVAAGPPCVPPRTPALLPHSSMYTVDRALPTVNGSQFSTMIVDRCDLLVSLYTAPSVVPAVTSVAPTAVHTSGLFSSGAYTQAPAGTFIAHTSHGPAVAFSIGTYPGWGNAAIPMGYPNPTPALPIPVMGGPTVSMVDPASTLFGILPTISSLPLLTDTTSTTTATVTSAVDSVSSELAPGLKFLALAPRPPGVATYPDGQALPVPAAATPAVPPPMATTPAAAQQPGSATAVHTAASTSTAATPAAPAVPPESTTTSSAVPTTSPPAVAVLTALPTSTAASSVVTAPPPSTSAVASSSSSTGVAVAVSSGSDLPGSTYIASTQSVPPPVIVVYSQDVLKRYDGSSSPKEYADHFDITADVNGWRTDLNKLKHLKAAFDGRAAYQIKDLDESDPAKALAALRAKLLSHFGSSNEASSARQQFCYRTQSEGEAIGEYADALLKLSKAGWPGQQRDTDLQSQFVQRLRLPELKEYLRLQYANLGFEETVKKARFYMEVKDTSKPKKASVQFASTERDPAVNAITLSTVDLEPIMNCLQDIKGRMDKMERRRQPVRASTPPSRSTSPTPSQSQNNQRGRSLPRPRNDNAGYQRDQFEDQQPQRFDDAPPQNYSVSPQPRRFQTPSVGWNDANYRPPTQAWGGADPRFQGTPPW